MIEELMPRDYYTNMLALRADIQLIYKLLAAKEPQLLDHLNSLSIDLSLITVESFLTIYTNTLHPSLVDVVIDHFLSQGPIVLLKAMVLIMGYLKEHLLKLDNFGSHCSSRRASQLLQKHHDAAVH
jgi:Rab-GTPase-TBC domain